MAMLTVSSREFRDNQKRYLDLIVQGEELLIARKNDIFKVIKVSTEDTIINKADLQIKK